MGGSGAHLLADYWQGSSESKDSHCAPSIFRLPIPDTSEYQERRILWCCRSVVDACEGRPGIPMRQLDWNSEVEVPNQRRLYEPCIGHLLAQQHMLLRLSMSTATPHLTLAPMSFSGASIPWMVQMTMVLSNFRCLKRTTKNSSQ